jgi:hypothetical protein
MAKSSKKVSLSILMVMFLTLCFSVMSAFAAVDITPIDLTATDVTEITPLFGTTGIFGASEGAKLTLVPKTGASTTGTGTTTGTTTTVGSSLIQKLVTLSSDGKGLVFNNKSFANATEKSRKDALGFFVRELQKSDVSEQTQQRVFDEMSRADSDVSRMLIPLVMSSTSADLYTAMKWVSPFLPILRLVFGIGAFCIFIFLMGSTIVDLAFIGLPIARESLQNKGEQKGGKVPFVSSDAMSVIKETESALDSSGGYKNAYLIYFKRRALTYIILSVCVLYLVVGELGGLIGWLLSLGSGVVGGS